VSTVKSTSGNEVRWLTPRPLPKFIVMPTEIASPSSCFRSGKLKPQLYQIYTRRNCFLPGPWFQFSRKQNAGGAISVERKI